MMRDNREYAVIGVHRFDNHAVAWMRSRPRPAVPKTTTTMKLFTTVVLSAAACLPLANSFQNAKPRTVSVVKNTGPPPSALFFSEAPPEDLQQKVSEMTAALERAQKRQAEAQEQAELTRAERSAVVAETDATIAELKSELR